MKHVVLTLCAALALVLFSCGEDEVGYQFPESSSEHITFTIDGQEQVLRGLGGPYSNTNPNRIRIDDTPGYNNSVSLMRSNASNSTRLRITGRDLPLVREDGSVSWQGEDFVPVTITVSGNEMSGSIYCPHVEDATSVTYEALMVIDKVNESGIVSGRFKTDPDASGNAAQLTEGSFYLAVNID